MPQVSSIVFIFTVSVDLTLTLHPSDHMYYFEGKDYSKDPSSEDQKSFDRLLEEQLAEFQRAAGEGRALRHKAGVRFCLLHSQLMGTGF